MRKTLKLLFVTILLSVLFAEAAGAKAVDINSLIENGKAMNNTSVTVEGEAIGEALERGDYSWVNINDGTNAIGIWLKKFDAEMIKYYGDYEHVGDTVRITGTFSNNCSEHGGDVDIHCTSIEIVKEGHNVKNEVPGAKILTAAVLLCAALTVVFIWRKELGHKKQL